MSDKSTVVIADDHPLVRDSLQRALEQPGLVTVTGLDVVAQAENGFEALSTVKRFKPDLLILDVAMPLASGVEVITDLRRWSPKTMIVILTGITSTGLIATLIDSGVNGLFSKGEPLNELYQNLPQILRGGHHIANPFIKALDIQQSHKSLTDRERQILNMIISGKSNKEMADFISVSPKTVDKHRTSLMQKLNVHSVVELMSYALREGLIVPDH